MKQGRYLFIYDTIFAKREDGQVDWAMDWDSLSLDKGWKKLLKAGFDPENREFRVQNGELFYRGIRAKSPLKHMVETFDRILEEEL